MNDDRDETDELPLVGGVWDNPQNPYRPGGQMSDESETPSPAPADDLAIKQAMADAKHAQLHENLASWGSRELWIAERMSIEFEKSLGIFDDQSLSADRLQIVDQLHREVMSCRLIFIDGQFDLASFREAYAMHIRRADAYAALVRGTNIVLVDRKWVERSIAETFEAEQAMQQPPSEGGEQENVN